MEWEVIFEDGSEYIVEADNKEDAVFEAEDKYCYDKEPLPVFHSKELIDEFKIPKIKSCNMV
jgi:hypothetical protein